jgi:hypothetical protein
MGLGIRAYETRIMDAFQLSSKRPPVMALRSENRSEKPQAEGCVLHTLGKGALAAYTFLPWMVGESDGSWTHLHHGPYSLRKRSMTWQVRPL